MVAFSVDAFCSLFKKELIVLRRSKLWTSMELAVPLLISIPIVWIVFQNSSTVKHEAQFWESFEVTGDWRDIDRRLGFMQSIYNYCGSVNRRSLGLVFPSDMDEKEVLWAAREIETRYLMNSSTFRTHDHQSTRQHDYKLYVNVFADEATMMEELLQDYSRSFRCTDYIAGIVFHEYNISAPRLSYTIRIRQTENPETHWYTGDDIWGNGGPYEILQDPTPVNYIPNYWSLGVLSLQFAVDAVFLKGIDGGKYSDKNFNFSLERMPEPPYFEKPVTQFLSFLIILWPLTALPCILHTAANIASEKDSGMKVVSPWLFVTTAVFYGAGATSFAVLTSCIFHSHGAATKGAIAIWLATIGAMHYRGAKELISLNIIFSLNINYAFMCALEAVQDYMNRDQYMHWYEIFDRVGYVFPFGIALLMMIFDILWMSSLAIYLDNVYPCGDLPRKHWLYFLPFLTEKYVQRASVDMWDAAPNDNIQNFEGSDEADIEVHHLTKKYAAQTAVNDMSFRAWRGNITILLGHNGAGKSTTLSMITGFTAPTSGSIYISGKRLESYSLVHCQKDIGFCPQYNALFELLTVREHLEIFRKLSGSSVNVDEMIANVQLADKADVVAAKLSGGMKRKLCVGISLIGGKRVVLLDEPTVGMDSASRNAIAVLLEQWKQNRTILVTTHYMDEADSLGDQIAIMVKGNLVCAGTSEFLKNRFGTGYLLSIDLMDRPCSFDRVNKLLEAIKGFVPETEVQSATPQQLTVLLPTETKNSFPELFVYLENHDREYGISSFGLSLNTLEQVFLRVLEMGESESTAIGLVDSSAQSYASVLCSRKSNRTGLSLWFEQLYALLRKRFICYRRRWLRLISQIFFPLILFLIAVLYVRNLPTEAQKRHGILLNAGRISPSVVLLQLEDSEAFAHDVERVIRNITGYSYKHVPASEDMSHHLVALPKIPPPTSVAIKSSMRNNSTIVTAFFNAKARYGPLIATTLISNSRLGTSADSIKLSFFPYGNVSSINPLVSVNSQLFVIAPILIVISAFITSGFVTYVVDDRSTKFMQQQLHTGLSAFIYWVSILVSDLILFTFTFVAIMLIIILFLDRLSISLIFDMAFLWLMYLWPTMPLVYCMAFLFRQPVRAYTVLMSITLVAALCANVVSYALISLKPAFFPYVQSVFLFIFPTYGLSYGMIMILVAVANSDFTDLYSWDKLGRVYVMMACSGILLWVTLMMINCKPLAVFTHNLLMRRRPRYKSDERENIDVKEERERVVNRTASVPLLVRGLNKYYGRLHAVRNLTFGVESGECFGLLGLNGAGKTTTFDMLTGESIPDDGEAFINGCSILKNRIVGFCPQFDALHPDLTARETLQLLASLCRFKDSACVKTALEAVSLTAQADICVKFLSGGQRRRLSLVVALIIGKDFVLLDEPTAGIDPKTRRQIWDLLGAMRKEKRAILLTSHTMDECEALCTRIGILDQGSLIAIGTPQHIKTKFGDKYTLCVVINDAQRREELSSKVNEIFPCCVQKSSYGTYLLWDIKKNSNDRWSELCQKVRKLAAQFPETIVDYSLAQSSLEEVFLQLSRRERSATSSSCPADFQSSIRI